MDEDFWGHIFSTSTAYLQARQRFEDNAKGFEPLVGNDNFIGRIGEALAWSCLESTQPNVREIGRPLDGGKSSPTVDFEVLNQMGEWTPWSVKTITSENKSGKTSRYHCDENGNWPSLIIVYLSLGGSMPELDVLCQIFRDPASQIPLIMKAEAVRNAKGTKGRVSKMIATRKLRQMHHGECWKLMNSNPRKPFVWQRWS